ncbi:catechol 2,3-dioxygenase [Citricoccus sp. SGAir0253]|uniref:VOC family protein n=1 Tax=Citricoccus sp. SGAir0253 TaxID=2567881 RepID=UPI0010CCB472|nr:VOC family protein [Citricoccus sp. SGAir0253]QCU78874.1 catechol 2,3-dioxygenase [Citricoccus sp. SGAir0253]
MTERIRDIAHLSTVELYTPRFEESLWFFRDLLAMREVGRTTEDGAESAYLHCWDDYEPYSIKLTAREHAGVGRVGWRANSPEALERVVGRIEAAGLGEGWVDGEMGRGRTFRYRDPDQHLMEVYYETEWYRATDEDRPALKNQASRYPGFGANARRLDHINYLTADMAGVCDFTEQVMGGFTTEYIQLDDGEVGGHWFTYGQKSYDVVYSDDWTGTPGRLHHIAFASDTREDILKAADIFLENGVYIEYGPYKHAIQQGFFLYVWEPGGNRIELANQGSRLILAPDWKPIGWTQAERAKGQAWGMKTISTFHTHGTPVVEGGDDVANPHEAVAKAQRTAERAGAGEPVDEGLDS